MFSFRYLKSSLLFCSRLLFAWYVNSISFPRSEPFILGHYRGRYCLINPWLIVFRKLLICFVIIKSEMKNHIQVIHLRFSGGEEGDKWREWALGISSKHNKLPFWINCRNETERKSLQLVNYFLWKKYYVSLLIPTFSSDPRIHSVIICYFKMFIMLLSNVLISLGVSSKNIILLVTALSKMLLKVT